MMIDIP